MRTEQNGFPDWVQIRADYEGDVFPSVRKLAERSGVSETAIRKKAKKEKWTKGAKQPAPPSLGALALREASSRGEQAAPSSTESIEKAAKADPLELIDRNRDVLQRLLDELDTVTCRQGELEEMIEAYTARDKDNRRYDALMKAISLPVRMAAAKNAAMALRTLTDAAPGKKAEAKRAAETAGHGSEWGEDLDVGVARAN